MLLFQSSYKDIASQFGEEYGIRVNYGATGSGAGIRNHKNYQTLVTDGCFSQKRRILLSSKYCIISSVYFAGDSLHLR